MISFISDLIAQKGFIFKYKETFPSSEHDVYELTTWVEDKNQMRYDYKKICVRDRENPQDVAFRKLLDSIIEHYCDHVSNKTSNRYVVIEDFNGILSLCAKNGETLVFDTYEDAQKEAEDCQNGKIVKL